MKRNIILVLVLFIAGAILFVSCRKEVSCEGCAENNDPSQPNRPPVANAGPDQTITLQTNTVMLDGSGSTDPDNNITTYAWTKISGPSSFNIVNTNAVQTQVANLVQGVYEFELKVTDAGGLFSKDTVQIAINPVVVVGSCNNSNRPQVTAQLIPVGNLTQARAGMAIAASGNTILFAGGGYITGSPVSSKVDIYNIATGSWSSTELSQARWGIASTVSGSKVFFAGGGPSFDNVDIYDISTNTWTLAHLSEPRSLLSAASAGNKVVFAGGTSNTPGQDANKKVDIYDLSTNNWSTAMLSESRFDLCGIAVGSKIYFGGGSDIAANSLSTIDIYNTDSNTWSSSSLQFVGDGATGITVNDNIYWTGFANDGQATVSKVEVRNITSGNSSVHCLSYRRYRPGVAVKNNTIVFFTGANIWGELKNKFDIYDFTTNTWSIGLLPVNIEGASIVSLNNSIYVAGGLVNGVASNQVWKLEF